MQIIMPNNLNTFKLLFLAKGILTFMVTLFFLGYALFGLYFGDIFQFEQSFPQEVGFNPGIIFFIIGGMGFFFTLIFGTLTLLASHYLNVVKHYNFIFVVAILNCLTGILGILLGVFTIIELNKPHVKELFDKNK